jgi:hypothetical protein
MAQPKLIYRTDGEWVAILSDGHLFDTLGEWIGWLIGNDVYALDGAYVGYISEDGRLLRPRVMPDRPRRRPPARRPRFQAPASVPLPPMFRELSYDTLDVFQSAPNVFGVISDVHPDAGEIPVSIAAVSTQDLTITEQEALEEMAQTMLQGYGVTEPPVPIEAIAVGARPDRAHTISRASSRDRLQLAERTVQRLGSSVWAVERGYCSPEGFTPAQIKYGARALLLPRAWLIKTPRALLRTWALAHRYAVPEEAARARLYDLPSEH